MPMARSCMVDEYIGTDFDAVKNVSDNIQTIRDISVAADDLDNIGDKLDSLVKLASNLETMQISEGFVLGENQQLVEVTKVVPEFMALYIRDQRVDSGRLFKNVDYSVLGATVFKLHRTYPAGTKLLAIQEITSEDHNAVIYDDKTVFNRTVVNLEVGAVLKDTKEYGEAIQPLLIYDKKQYICQTALPVEHTIISTAVLDCKDGYIKVTTDKGVLMFNEQEARALPQKDIKKLFHNSWSNIFLKPSNDWVPEQWINSITYKILVDGIEYFPVRVPFTTDITWEMDRANWLPVFNAIPEEIDVTGKNTIEMSKEAKRIIVSAQEDTIIVAFSDIGQFREIVIIPETDNITLVHSDTHLRLANTTTLELSTNCVYKFMTDGNGIPRQVM